MEACYLYMLPEGLSEPGLNAARKICEKLSIKLHVIEAGESFERIVISYFTTAYSKGLTPNPCIICNPNVKFKECLNLAQSLGFDKIATGHYARTVTGPAGTAVLQRGVDRSKDQSYFLHQVPATILSHALFPLGDSYKSDVKKIGADMGLGGLVLEDSQEVCFLRGDYRAFLERLNLGPGKPGPIITTDGRVLGTHKGLHAYTVGQRRGLGIPDKTPYYVLSLDTKRNALVVGKADQLLKERLLVKGLNIYLPDGLMEGLECEVQIRSRHRPSRALIRLVADDTVEVTFKEPQRAITPGQFAVFYRGDLVIGGGRICE